MRRILTIVIAVALVVPASIATLVALAPAASASPPTITSVKFGGNPANPSVFITGSGFGTIADLGTPEPFPCGPDTGDDYGENLILRDLPNGWAGGEGPGDCVGLVVTSYSDTQISYTLGSFYGPPSYVLAPGDGYEVDVLGATVTGFVSYPREVGEINTVAGNANSGYAGDGIPATSAQLATPYGEVVDSSGNLIIADVDAERVRVVASSIENPGYPLAGCAGTCTWTIGDIYTIAGTGVGGSGGDGDPATTSHVDTPSSVAVDHQGNVLITDTDDGWVRVLAVSPGNPGYGLRNDCGGGFSPCVWTQGDLFTFASADALGITVDASDNTVFAGSGVVEVHAISATDPGYDIGGATWTVGQSFIIAGVNSDPAGFNGDGLSGLLTDLNGPAGVAVDPSGNPVFTDSQNDRLRVLAVSTSNPGYPLADSCGVGGTPPFDTPCTWAKGDVFTIAGTGSAGDNADEDGLPATTANVNGPNDVTIDAHGNPIIADTFNNLVEIVAVSASNPGYTLGQHCGGGGTACSWTPGNIYSLAGDLPQSAGFGGDSSPGPAALLFEPEAVALDASGNLYIADTSNSRVREVTVGQGALPADAGSPNGVDTNQTSPGSVTLSASGTWNNNGTDGSPDGNGGATTGSFLLPSAPAGALIGRIGTSGPWTLIGTGPTVINGAGELFLAMNDDPADFVNDSGSLIVGASAAETITSGYTPIGPILAGANLTWQGDVTNDSASPQTNMVLEATSGSTLENPPNWSVHDSEFGVLRTGSCVLEPDSRYSCGVGTVSPGDTAEVTTVYSTAGIEPQTMADDFEMTSDQAQPDPSHPALAASPPATLEIDGLEFDIPAPSEVSDGTPLTINGTVTNTSETQTINNATVSGAIDAGSFTSVPSGCQFTNDIPLGSGASYTCPTPFALGPGVTVPGSVTVDTTGLGGRDIDYLASANSPDIGGESYVASGSVFIAPDTATVLVPTSTSPVAPSITAGADAGWTVPITNSDGSAAVGVTVTLDATATDTNSVSTPLGFDTAAINTSLGLPANASTCAPGAGNTEVCTLPADIPAHSVQQFSAFAVTTGLSPGSTITGDISVTATNAAGSAGTLSTVTVSACATGCTTGVAAPGTPFPSAPPTVDNPTQQVLVLTSNTANSTALPPVDVTLQSITPSGSESPSDQKLCPTAPTATHCSGQISSVTALLNKYDDAANPIRVTIVARWGASVPAGRILMEKNSGGDPLFLNACVVDPTTRDFNVPCVLPELVRGSAAADNLTTYDTILFTGLDIHFARRVSTGGTVIKPPAAPTALTATAGVLKATLKWKAPTVTNGAGVTGYVVTVLLAGKVVKTVAYNTAALTETVTGLAKGKSYTFKVAAKNVAGTGAASAVSRAVTPT